MTTPEPLWSDDRIGEMVDRNSFDVIYKERIIRVVSGAMTEGLALEMRDEYEADRAALYERIAALEAKWRQVAGGSPPFRRFASRKADSGRDEGAEGKP